MGKKCCANCKLYYEKHYFYEDGHLYVEWACDRKISRDDYENYQCKRYQKDPFYGDLTPFKDWY